MMSYKNLTMKFMVVAMLCFFECFMKCNADNLHQHDSNLQQQHNYCTDLNPQNSVAIDQITGMWYGNEVIQHRETNDGEMAINSCVVLHISDINDEMILQGRQTNDEHNIGKDYRNQGYQTNRGTYNYLRLIWDEKGSELEYVLRYNTSRRGFWIASAPQKGETLNLPYNQFTGTLQVMKAVANHLVLTFCQTQPSGHLFSIVLSRQPNSITHDDILSVRELLKRRRLDTTYVRKVCKSAATTLDISKSAISVILFFGISLFFSL